MSSSERNALFYPVWPVLGKRLNWQWSNQRQNVSEAKALVRSTVLDVQDGEDILNARKAVIGREVGELDFQKKWRTYYKKDVDRWTLQRNTGTQAVPVWVDALTLNDGDGALIHTGKSATFTGIIYASGGIYADPGFYGFGRAQLFTGLSGVEWVVNHNFMNTPVIPTVYNNDDKIISPSSISIDVSDPNTAYFYFATARTGKVLITTGVTGAINVVPVISVTDGDNTYSSSGVINVNNDNFYLSGDLSGAPVINLEAIPSGTNILPSVRSALFNDTYIIKGKRESIGAFANEMHFDAASDLNSAIYKFKPRTSADRTTEDLSIAIADASTTIASGDNRLVLNTNANSSIVINDSGVDADFRVEGDNDQYLICTDATVDHVGIGTNTPTAKLHVHGDIKSERKIVADGFYLNAGGELKPLDIVDGENTYHEVSELNFSKNEFYLSSDLSGNPVVNIEGLPDGVNLNTNSSRNWVARTKIPSAGTTVTVSRIGNANTVTRFFDQSEGTDGTSYERKSINTTLQQLNFDYGNIGAISINESKDDVDIQIKGVTTSDFITVDAADERVGINVSASPTAKLDIGGDLRVRGKIRSTGTNSGIVANGFYLNRTAGGELLPLTVRQSNGLQSFRSIAQISFEAANFYIKQNVSGDRDEVQVNFRGTSGTGGGSGISSVNFEESESGGASFSSDTLIVDSAHFYLTSAGGGDPILSFGRAPASMITTDYFYMNATNVHDAIVELVDKNVDMREPTGFVDRVHSEISFTNFNHTFTIEPVGTQGYDIYTRGKKSHITTTKTLVIPDVEGTHYIYFDSNAILQSTQSPPSGFIESVCIVSIIYWNADADMQLYLADERHGIQMDGNTHSYLHYIFGAQWEDGLALGNFSIDGTGALATNAQFSVDEGEIHDEDLEFDIPAQVLPAAIPIYYKWGTTPVWRRKEANPYPLIYSGTAGYTGAAGRAPYNQNDAGDWKLTEIANAQFGLVHYFATNDRFYGVIGVQGENDYATITGARNAASTEISTITQAGMAFAEFTPIGTTIFQTSAAYTNVPKARFRSDGTGANYIDFRGSTITGTGGGAAGDHGSLTGLSDDDHTQYTLVAGTRAFTGDQSMGSNKITNLAAPTATTDAARLQDVINYAGGFYGVIFKESGIGGTKFRTDTLVADSRYFYLTSSGDNKPLLSSKGLTVSDGTTVVGDAITLYFDQEHFDVTAGPTVAIKASVYTVGTSTRVISNGFYGGFGDFDKLVTTKIARSQQVVLSENAKNITMDWSTSNVFFLPLRKPVTIHTPTNLPSAGSGLGSSSQVVQLITKNDGFYNMIWSRKYIFPGGGQLGPSKGTGRIDLWSMLYLPTIDKILVTKAADMFY